MYYNYATYVNFLAPTVQTYVCTYVRVYVRMYVRIIRIVSMDANRSIHGIIKGSQQWKNGLGLYVLYLSVSNEDWHV